MGVCAHADIRGVENAHTHQSAYILLSNMHKPMYRGEGVALPLHRYHAEAQDHSPTPKEHKNLPKIYHRKQKIHQKEKIRGVKTEWWFQLREDLKETSTRYPVGKNHDAESAFYLF